MNKSLPKNEAEPSDSALTAADLINRGQGMVRSIALQVHRSLPIPCDLEDLIAYGQLGLVEAAQSYRCEQGTKFTTFAYYRIRGAVYDGVSKMSWTSRARLRKVRFQRLADEVLENDCDSGGQPKTATETAAWLGKVTERLAVVYLASGDDSASENSLERVADRSDSPLTIVANRDLQIRLKQMVNSLSPEAKRLINDIYFEGFSLTEAANRLGLSKSWASRLHAKTLDQLAKSLKAIDAFG